MAELLPFIPALPLVGFVVLVLIRRLPPRAVAAIGVGSVAAATAVALYLAARFLAAPPMAAPLSVVVWQWMHVGDFAPQIALRLDALSLAMVLVVTVVGLLIHVYSVAFMAGDEGYGRFFAYMNLFVACMLTLVLADDLLLLYLGWEGVGLCSYLLIGFWYKDPANGRAARKAFIITRVGDAAMAVGLFLLFTRLGTLSIPDVLDCAAGQWAVGSPVAIAAAALLLAGAVGKSAQLPLQTWLPDAMAGPTPVSALIHAATMVTAGVYLVARTHVLFELAPPVHHLVAAIGAVTLVLAGVSAATQRDIKRVIAYSTISQIGYMFLALGVGAWAAGIYHFVTHAFFKSLLFLGAGAVIYALQDEHDLFRMGGLWKRLPLTFATFLVAAMALAALPPTAGFASKDLMLYRVWASPDGGWLFALALAGVFLTALYTFRMVFLAFMGPLRAEPARRPPWAMTLPMAVLAVFCVALAALDWPASLAGRPVFSRFLEAVLPAAPEADASAELRLQIVSTCVCLAGIFAAWVLALRARGWAERTATSGAGAPLHALWRSGWGFDWLYDHALVRPYVWLARVNRDDCMDAPFQGIAHAVGLLNRLLAQTQTGMIRWYAGGIVVGAIVLIVIMVLT